MSDNTVSNDDLHPAYEPIIAGGVILLFGLLYWWLNPGWFGSPQSPSLASGQVATQNAVNFAVQPDARLNPTATAEAPTPDTDTSPSPVTSTRIVEPVGNTPKQVVQAATNQTALVTHLVPPDAQQAIPAKSEPASPIQQQSQSPATSVDLKLLAGSAEAIFQSHLAKGVLEQPLTLDKVQFAPGSTEIAGAGAAQLQTVATLLAQYPQANVLITGHTDELGPEKSSLHHSLMRANAVGKLLVEAGIARQRITIMGMGEKAPLDANNTEAGRMKNRRIEISLTN